MYNNWLDETVVSDEKYEEMEKKNKDILLQIEQKNSILDKLKENEMVRKYADVFNEKTKLEEEQEDFKRDLAFQRMMHCNHYYVRNYVDSFYDGHRTETNTIVTCIHCGLTNKFVESGIMDDVFPYDQMSEIVRGDGMRYNGYHGDYSESQVDEVKKIYDNYKDEYPKATDKDCERHIKMVMKMRKKKGNKKDD